MKCLVFSDSHGHLEYMTYAVNLEKPDQVLHLGDVVRDARGLQKAFPDLPMDWVQGNCDGYNGDTDDPEEKEVFFAGRRLWILHGHTYGVKMGTGMLTEAARSRGVDVVLFGHTHTPLCDRSGSLWIVNPGTASGLPQATYAVIEDQDGRFDCRIEQCPRQVEGQKKRPWLW